MGTAINLETVIGPPRYSAFRTTIGPNGPGARAAPGVHCDGLSRRDASAGDLGLDLGPPVPTRTGPPDGSTRGSQPAQRCTGRPGISRTGRDRASGRPSCGPPAGPADGTRRRAARTGRAGGRRLPGTDRVGRDPPQRRLDHDRHPDPGRRPGPARARPRAPRAARLAAAMCRAAWRPVSAATSAVSAACTRLPAANTPGSRRAQRGVHRRPAGAGVHSRPGQPGQLVVGDPVPGEHHRSHGTTATAPVRRSRSSHARSAVPGPTIPADRRRVHTGTRQRTAAPSRNAGVALLPRLSVTSATTSAPGVRQRHTAEKLTCSAPTTSGPARPAARRAGTPAAAARPWSSRPAGRLAGHQPGRPRPLPAPGGQQHRRRAARSRCRPELVSVTASSHPARSSSRSPSCPVRSSAPGRGAAAA